MQPKKDVKEHKTGMMETSHNVKIYKREGIVGESFTRKRPLVRYQHRLPI